MFPGVWVASSSPPSPKPPSGFEAMGGDSSPRDQPSSRHASPKQRSTEAAKRKKPSQETASAAAAAAADDDDSDIEMYASENPVLQRFIDMKLMLHAKLAVPKDVDMPPYRLLGRFCMNSPELWGHSLAALAEEWCCAYLNTSGGMLILGVTADGTIEGLPLNTHHSQLHAFLAPFFSCLDQFWPAVSHGLVTVALLPVHTAHAHFEPYYVIVIRVKRGPFPIYANSRRESYSGDHALQQLSNDAIQARLAQVDPKAMTRYLQSYYTQASRTKPTLGEVLKGEKPYVFHYSSHWSHPPLTLIPESATMQPVGKGGVAVKGDHGHLPKNTEGGGGGGGGGGDAQREGGDEGGGKRGNREPPCKHNKWRFHNSTPSGVSNYPFKVNLLCAVCDAAWSQNSRKGTVDDVRCKYHAKGHCRDGTQCKFNHIVGAADGDGGGGGGGGGGGKSGTPKMGPKTPKKRDRGILSGLSRTPDHHPQQDTRAAQASHAERDREWERSEQQREREKEKARVKERDRDYDRDILVNAAEPPPASAAQASVQASVPMGASASSAVAFSPAQQQQQQQQMQQQQQQQMYAAPAAIAVERRPSSPPQHQPPLPPQPPPTQASAAAQQSPPPPPTTQPPTTLLPDSVSPRSSHALRPVSPGVVPVIPHVPIIPHAAPPAAAAAQRASPVPTLSAQAEPPPAYVFHGHDVPISVTPPPPPPLPQQPPPLTTVHHRSPQQQQQAVSPVHEAGGSPTVAAAAVSPTSWSQSSPLLEPTQAHGGVPGVVRERELSAEPSAAADEDPPEQPESQTLTLDSNPSAVCDDDVEADAAAAAAGEEASPPPPPPPQRATAAGATGGKPQTLPSKGRRKVRVAKAKAKKAAAAAAAAATPDPAS